MTNFTLPLLYEADAVVRGGNISGMVCACMLRSTGKSVLLIEEGTCLYQDMHQCGDYTVPNIQDMDWRERLFPDAAQNGNGLLHPAKLKRYGEKLLKNQGIQILYSMSVIHHQRDRTGRTELTAAHKSGLYSIRCDAYYNCVQQRSSRVEARSKYLLHVVQGPEILPDDLPLPFAIHRKCVSVPKGSLLALSRGSAGGGHCVLSIPVLWETEEQMSPESQQALHQIALETLIEYKKIAGLTQLTPARSGLLCRSPDDSLIQRYISEGEAKADNPETPMDIQPLQATLRFPNPLWAGKEATVCKLPEPESTWHGDILVVGGGTSGAAAALYAAKYGMRTLLLEMNGMLGGTATAGGVSTYWFGLRGGATEEIDQQVDRYYRRASLERSACLWNQNDVFLPDIKALALLDMCLAEGCDVRFHSTVCAVISEDEHSVQGVAYVKNGKLHLAYAKTVIDCTGDGDVAMFAGAAHTYGSREDALTYWASLAQYTGPDSYRNNFSTMVHVGDPLDYTRFILAGRQRGGDVLDHGEYVALRESRHIQGMAEVTLHDLLAMKYPKDTLYVCFSNYDPKGKLSADVVYHGLLPPNLLVAVPKGAVVPVAADGSPIEGLLVGGKAISCTHNALPALRMQPDLQQQGKALAALAETCVSRNVPAWLVDDLDRQIIDADIARSFPVPGNADLQAEVDALDGCETLEWLDASPASHMEKITPEIACYLAGDQAIVPVLLESFVREPQGTPKQLLLARMLLWHGNESGARLIVQTIHDMLQQCEGLPRRTGSVTFGQLLPDHGLMPETVYLLNSLANAKHTEIIPVFEETLCRIHSFARDWYDLRQGIFCYIEAFAYVAIRRKDICFLTMLRKLMTLPEFSDAENDALKDTLMRERLDMLKLMLLQAITVLGGEDGISGLQAFTQDERRPIALSAEMILSNLSKPNHSVLRKY